MEEEMIMHDQRKAIKDLETLLGKPIPLEQEIYFDTFGVKIEGNTIVGLGLYERDITTLPESIGKLTSLQELSLQYNKLSTLPESIGKLTSLKRLDIEYNNRLMFLPESIGNLKSLKGLYLYENKLRTLPKSIGNLLSLQTLILAHNQLSILPESIGNLTSLQTLRLEYNKLTTLPESIGKLTSLQTLRLGYNQLSTIPESISNLKSLKELYLGSNKLKTLPESIGNLTSLQKLFLEGNQLSILPESFWRLNNLSRLDLKNNPWAVEWIKIIDCDIPTIIKLCRKLYGIIIFLSHSMKDEEEYQFLELVKYLENIIIIQENGLDINIIYKVFFCERDLIEDIWEFMSEKVPQSHLLLFIATHNSIISEPCQYELFLAKKYGIKILLIKGRDISWKDLTNIPLIDRKKQPKGVLNLSTPAPKEKFEFNGKSSKEICEEVGNYIKKYESKLRDNKKGEKLLYKTKQNIINLTDSEEFNKLLINNYEDFITFLQELNKNEVTPLQMFLKILTLINKK